MTDTNARFRYDDNRPPDPELLSPPVPQRSFLAYVWRGDKFDDIGFSETSGDGHILCFTLGVTPPDVIELRATAEEFYPGWPRPGASMPQPTFLVYDSGTENRAGTAWPHPDGKGHRLKLRHTIDDGARLDLRDTGHFLKAPDKNAARMRFSKKRSFR